MHFRRLFSSTIFHQVLKKGVEILIQVVHHDRIDDDGIIVNDIKFMLLVLLIVFEYEGEGLQHR